MVLLRSWITGTLSEEALYLVVGCKTAKNVWDCLEENYLQATKEREVQLRRQMQQTKKGTQSLADYLKTFKAIFDGLAAIQKPVAEDDKVMYMSQGLGSRYEVLVTSMISKPPFPSYAQFVTALQSYNLRLQNSSMEEKSIDQSMAFLSQRSNGGRGRGNVKRRGNSNGYFNSQGRGFFPAGQPYKGGKSPFEQQPCNNSF